MLLRRVLIHPPVHSLARPPYIDHQTIALRAIKYRSASYFPEAAAATPRRRHCKAVTYIYIPLTSVGRAPRELRRTAVAPANCHLLVNRSSSPGDSFARPTFAKRFLYLEQGPFNKYVDRKLFRRVYRNGGEEDALNINVLQRLHPVLPHPPFPHSLSIGVLASSASVSLFSLPLRSVGARASQRSR